MFVYIDFHRILSGIIIFSHLLIAAYLVRRIWTKRLANNFYTQALCAIFCGFSGLSVFLLFLFPKLNAWYLEIPWFLGQIFPVLIFMLLRRPILASVQGEYVLSQQRFHKLKEEFLSMASHELRTPLSVISGFAEILIRERLGPLNDEQMRRVKKILLQAQRLSRIVNELLDLSRIRSGKIETVRQVFDIVPVLKSCLDDHEVVCEQEQLRLIDHIPDVLPDVEADLERLTQVLVNIMNNAVKYTPAGGEISLTAKVTPDNKFLRIEVQDTGVGIANEHLGKIFDEFYRIHQENGKKYAGSGLGLTIVRQLVEAQGGIVGATSEGTGKGTLFYFTLPLAKSLPNDIGLTHMRIQELSRAKNHTLRKAS